MVIELNRKRLFTLAEKIIARLGDDEPHCGDMRKLINIIALYSRIVGNDDFTRPETMQYPLGKSPSWCLLGDRKCNIG
jgi:hypothetical protein